MSKNRKWNEEYIQYSFTCSQNKDISLKPQCLICGTVFANSSMKPSKLKEHFINSHGGSNAMGNDLQTLKAKKLRLDSQPTLFDINFLSAKKPLLNASYSVALRIVKANKPHNIAETLIKPCLLDLVTIILGTEARKNCIGSSIKQCYS